MNSAPTIHLLEPRRLLSAGQLSANFGNLGRIFDPHIDASQSRDIVIQKDGKILVAMTNSDGAGYQIERLLPQGSIDPSFGQNGTASLDFGRFPTNLLSSQAIETFALQSDGKIIVAGEADGGFAVARLRIPTARSIHPSASPDSKSSFGPTQTAPFAM